MFVINGRDSLFRLSYEDPLNPLHREPLTPVLVITPSMGPDVPYWRESFACSAFRTWNDQGQVWVTMRSLAAQPVRAWTWVEGDDSRMKWDDVHRFFASFDHSQLRGGSDGFFLLEKSPETLQILRSNIRGGTEQGCAR